MQSGFGQSGVGCAARLAVADGKGASVDSTSTGVSVAAGVGSGPQAASDQHVRKSNKIVLGFIV